MKIWVMEIKEDSNTLDRAHAHAAESAFTSTISFMATPTWFCKRVSKTYVFPFDKLPDDISTPKLGADSLESLCTGRYFETHTIWNYFVPVDILKPVLQANSFDILNSVFRANGLICCVPVAILKPVVRANRLWSYKLLAHKTGFKTSTVTKWFQIIGPQNGFQNIDRYTMIWNCCVSFSIRKTLWLPTWCKKKTQTPNNGHQDIRHHHFQQVDILKPVLRANTSQNTSCRLTFWNPSD